MILTSFAAMFFFSALVTHMCFYWVDVPVGLCKRRVEVTPVHRCCRCICRTVYSSLYMIHAQVFVNVSCCWSTSVACEHTFTLSIVSHNSYRLVSIVSHLDYRLVSIVLHMFCRLVSIVYTLATFMVESIVQHISGQLVLDDCLVA